ncbi:hypothetical protein Hanom_Chr12g01163321 [Helianthus anomalus]
MFNWIYITLAVASAGIFLLIFFFSHHLFRHPKPPQPPTTDPSLSQRETCSKTLFNWSDNPALITDAVENGWSRFAFTDYVSSSSVRSNRFSLRSCAVGADGVGEYDDDVDISWEICHGSADFMQKIRLNSGLKKLITTTTSAMSAASVIKSALPLPGPAVGNSSAFPQEAYFEIKILSSYEGENGGDVNGEDENVKLIQEGRGVHVNMEELRGQSCAKGIDEGGNYEVNVMASVGFTVGGSIPVKLPGSYPGSVGFHSDGSIYLDGMFYISPLSSDICLTSLTYLDFFTTHHHYL